ncbi:MAG: ATP-binding protein [Saprospiraceae bacterium]
MNSPFKFLDAYTIKDQNHFFGRDEEIDNLYNQIKKSSIILVYGPSGTGKTSLIQCGLGAHFNSTDWYNLLIRRNDDINKSLQESLENALNFKKDRYFTSRLISLLYKKYLCPVYLIFDQFEELFILGTPYEQSVFIQSIKSILDDELPCKIILVMREEYLAHLYSFETKIPNLFDHRVRVESMNLQNVATVIRKSCSKFNISLETDKNIQQIIDQVSLGKSGIQLPYLQIYLDSLWKIDYNRTYPKYPHEYPPDVSLPAPLSFNSKEILELGTIENVLQKFLQSQIADLQKEMKRKYPDLANNAVSQVIDIFVTESGTKRPIKITREEGNIKLDEDQSLQLNSLPQKPVRDILARLENLRVLRSSDNLIELGHDSLAYLIDKDRSAEQRQLNNWKHRILADFENYQKNGIFLNSQQLEILDSQLVKLNLDPNILQFIEACKEEVGREKRRQLVWLLVLWSFIINSAVFTIISMYSIIIQRINNKNAVENSIGYINPEILKSSADTTYKFVEQKI